MAGSREDVQTVQAFFQDMRVRGLNDPLLVVTDGAPGIIRAAEECFPTRRSSALPRAPDA
jgi:putative transposase